MDDMLQKSPTGIEGFDEITNGGIPQGRPSLIVGGAGSGKTLFGTEFLVKGIKEFGEPGVMISFEETTDDLIKNTESLGFNLRQLIEDKKLIVDHIRVERNEIEETGEYDLEGLFLRISFAVESIGAKRIVLDTIETLFSGLSNEAVLRAELRRLFHWLKERSLTAVVTGERGDNSLTRYGLEEYIADCVILLDNRVINQISTRRMRILKYRGSSHGTNEYPFLIDEEGFSVLPITSATLTYELVPGYISSGIDGLDAMLADKGYAKGSSALVSGTPGTGKTSVACSLAASACEVGQKCIYFAFEESPNQIMRNMESIGIELKPYVEQGLLKFIAARPSMYGLELHLVTIHKEVTSFRPDIAIFDPMSNLIGVGTKLDITSMFTRLVDFLKTQHITSLFTSLTEFGRQEAGAGVSSLMDTWIILRDVEAGGERNRTISIIKSRGLNHSNKEREFRLTDDGIHIIDVYRGDQGVLVGTERELAQEKRPIAAEAGS